MTHSLGTREGSVGRWVGEVANLESHVGTGRYFSEEILVHINAMYSSTNFNSI
jgi:hypothetical protein